MALAHPSLSGKSTKSQSYLLIGDRSHKSHHLEPPDELKNLDLLKINALIRIICEYHNAHCIDSTEMVSSKPNKRISQFAIAVLLTGGIAALFKSLCAFLGDRYLYSLPILGGFLQSIELIEVSNFLIFAFLGFAIGITTRFLPQRSRERLGVLVILILAPVVFSTSYLTRHYLWVQQVAERTNLPAQEAQSVTDVFLENGSGHRGPLGYYLYTAKMPLLPTTAQDIEDLSATEERIQTELTQVSGIEAQWFSLMFDVVGWSIRGFYILITLITVSLYFYKGLGQVRTAQQRRTQES